MQLLLDTKQLQSFWILCSLSQAIGRTKTNGPVGFIPTGVCLLIVLANLSFMNYYLCYLHIFSIAV